MQRIILLAIVFALLVGLTPKAMANTEFVNKLSEQAKVVIFTCDPGNELYAGFGHNAIWVVDTETNTDRLYNYGTFDFDTPNFYLKFIRGKLDYQLSVSTINRFLTEYNHRGIGVYGQTLNLTAVETQRMFDFLENNLKPENRFYRYDFFYDNCATRIRDVIIEIADGEVDFCLENQNVSFRQMLFTYLGHTPWTQMGINIILGLPADKIAKPYEYMFLPDYIKLGFEDAIIMKDGEKRKLVSQGQEYLPMQLTFTRNTIFDPVIVLMVLLLLFVIVTSIELKIRRHFKIIDLTLMYLSIVAGVFLYLMWVATDHSATNYNLNSLWLVPSQIVFLIVLYKPAYRNLTLFAFLYTALVSVVQWVWPQETETSFLLINLIFALRFWAHYQRNSKRAGQPLKG